MAMACFALGRQVQTNRFTGLGERSRMNHSHSLHSSPSSAGQLPEQLTPHDDVVGLWPGDLDNVVGHGVFRDVNDNCWINARSLCHRC